MENYTNLKGFRALVGVTQKQAAESIGIEQQQWQRYEKGINEFPIRYLVKLCKIYNISSDYILGLSTSPKKEERETE